MVEKFKLPEHRRGYVMGIAPAEWVIIALAAIGALIQYGAYGEAIKHNKETNDAQDQVIQRDIPEAVQKSESRTRSEIKASEDRTKTELSAMEKRVTDELKNTVDPLREDIREIRNILIKKCHKDGNC